MELGELNHRYDTSVRHDSKARMLPTSAKTPAVR